MAEKSVVVKRIVYGNSSKPIPREPDSANTHQWTLYVRSATNEPLEHFVKRVTFTLHPSFKPATRVVDSPPFEVVEKGWGEFEAQIKIQFHTTSIKSVNLRHFMKLFPHEKTVRQDSDTLITESYDELVFTNPTEAMGRFLLKETSPMLQTRGRDYADIETKQLKAIEEARAKVEGKIEASKKNCQELEKESAALKQQLAQLQSD